MSNEPKIDPFGQSAPAPAATSSSDPFGDNSTSGFGELSSDTVDPFGASGASKTDDPFGGDSSNNSEVDSDNDSLYSV